MADSANDLNLNFSIEETSESMGSTELIKDLLSPETQTSNVEELEEIKKETPPPPQKAKPKAPVSEKIAEEEDENSSQNLLASFLETGEDEESDETPPSIEKSEEKSEEDEEQEVSIFNTFAKDLFKIGVFQKEEDEEEVEIKTPEQFLERFNIESGKKATEMLENFLGRFGEDYRNAFEAIFEKGVSPKEYLKTYSSVVDFAELDLTQESNQEMVIRQSLADQGFEDEEITAEIDRLKNYGDLEPVATRHHKSLVKKGALKLQQMEQDAEREMQQKAAIKNQYIQNVQQILQEKVKEKEFDGIPLNAKIAAELQDFLLVDKWRTPNGETLTEFDKAILELKKPENHATKVKVALLLKTLEKDPKLTTIQRSAITKKSDQLFSEVARQASGKKVVKNNNNTTWF